MAGIFISFALLGNAVITSDSSLIPLIPPYTREERKHLNIFANNRNEPGVLLSKPACYLFSPHCLSGLILLFLNVWTSLAQLATIFFVAKLLAGNFSSDDLDEGQKRQTKFLIRTKFLSLKQVVRFGCNPTRVSVDIFSTCRTFSFLFGFVLRRTRW